MTDDERKKAKSAASMKYQRRMQTEDSPEATRWRETRRRLERERHARDRLKRNEERRARYWGQTPEERARTTEAKRLSDMTRRLAADNARKHAAAENSQREKSAVAQASKKRLSDALATIPAANYDRMTVEQFVAAGGVVEVLASNIVQAYAGLNANRIALY